MKIEICVDSLAGAQAAERAGADRVELCAGLSDGGTTPSAGMIQCVRAAVALKLMVIIRPRAGDFLYSDDEARVMAEDVRVAKALRADGVVLGCLRPDGSVDSTRTAALIAAARPLEVTFHRAFDVCREPFEALEELVRLGVDRVLTSGQKRTALEGAGLIVELQRRAAGRIAVMAGGGIIAANAREIVQRSGVGEIHMGCRTRVESAMAHRNPDVAMGAAGAVASEYTTNVTDEDAVRRAVELLRELPLGVAGRLTSPPNPASEARP
jgi:copper homeostasis protein